jgi:uncharacterized membrane protein YgcG
VLRALCEQCRSANFNLRFGSLWALKHLCLGLPQATKIQCLDELGVGWLVQVLNGEPSKPVMATPNAAGEQVDLLNATDEPHMDVDEESSEEEDEDEEDEDTMAESIPTMGRFQRPGSRYTSANNIRDRLQQIRTDEHDSRLSGERDDIRIQEQALDFIRNFISEEQSTGDMIDHILKSFGHSRFFDLLDAKIRPKTSSSSASSSQSPAPSYWPNTTQRSFSTSTNQQQQVNWSFYPAPELILATTFVLVHLANGRPAHRSLLISQTSLMQHLLPILSHPKREVRACCAWCLHNLLWLDDSSDQDATRERALLLRNLGFEEASRNMLNDTDLDVSQRAKTVVDRFTVLLGDGHAQGHTQSQRGSVYGSGGGSQFGGDGGMGGLGRLGGLHGWRHDSRG